MLGLGQNQQGPSEAGTLPPLKSKMEACFPPHEASNKHTAAQEAAILFHYSGYFAQIMFTHWHLIHSQTKGGTRFMWSAPLGPVPYKLTSDWPSNEASPKPIRAPITFTLIRVQPLIEPQRLIKAMHRFFFLVFLTRPYLKYYIIFVFKRMLTIFN